MFPAGPPSHESTIPTLLTKIVLQCSTFHVPRSTGPLSSTAATVSVSRLQSKSLTIIRPGTNVPKMGINGRALSQIVPNLLKRGFVEKYITDWVA